RVLFRSRCWPTAKRSRPGCVEMALLGGKTALVTGAGSGIGKACALELARAGARVIATDIDQDAALSTVRLILASSHHDSHTEGAQAVSVDVSNEAAVKRTMANVLEREPVHILANCAGVGATRAFLDTDA